MAPRADRIALVVEDPLARSWLQSLFEAGGVEVVASLASPDDLLTGDSGVGDVDVIVWDTGVRGADTTQALELLQAGPPRSGGPAAVLALSSDPVVAQALFAAGVTGVVARDLGADAYLAALMAVRAGLRTLSPGFEPMPPPAPGPAPAAVSGDLTPREREVLSLLVLGLSNREIAGRLGISDHTAKFHVNAVMQKLGVQSRTEAAVKAVRLGWVSV